MFKEMHRSLPKKNHFLRKGRTRWRARIDLRPEVESLGDCHFQKFHTGFSITTLKVNGLDIMSSGHLFICEHLLRHVVHQERVPQIKETARGIGNFKVSFGLVKAGSLVLSDGERHWLMLAPDQLRLSIHSSPGKSHWIRQGWFSLWNNNGLTNLVISAGDNRRLDVFGAWLHVSFVTSGSFSVSFRRRRSLRSIIGNTTWVVIAFTITFWVSNGVDWREPEAPNYTVGGYVDTYSWDIVTIVVAFGAGYNFGKRLTTPLKLHNFDRPLLREEERSLVFLIENLCSKPYLLRLHATSNETAGVEERVLTLETMALAL
ncbi:hypothetical protein Tco_0501898 [Tanacetum coccineum]